MLGWRGRREPAYYRRMALWLLPAGVDNPPIGGGVPVAIGLRLSLVRFFTADAGGNQTPLQALRYVALLCGFWLCLTDKTVIRLLGNNGRMPLTNSC